MSIFKSIVSMSGSSKSISNSTSVFNGDSSNTINQTSNSSTQFDFARFNPSLPGAPIIVDYWGNIICRYKKKF
ncbi:hypothetical protein DDB_G0284623 [Dictyostelium discoideum AX4]|uniref:Uncharacterized protein n=1 Tax=Dictyostelium discoideum TaxID=44689 RepID=Q54PD7_DICDI|nr:hypothetical protein DDB_G0284623 [Dictyostelium discoideum AX4]EAL65081.1 hypothetical protein DDB_G0284623 [Dictyostelium discoideum AX4]|eukprot:XP_638438.1 hypothetical protein DDB_G0284623 [Dictyostelium discoideum AX4]